MLSVLEAQTQLLQMAMLQEPELCPLADAEGRFLAQAIFSPVHLPPFDNSAMDGYALCLSEESAPADATFTIVSRIAAGDAPDIALKAGQAARIFTGAPIPKGANAVVMQEAVNLLDAQTIQLTKSIQLQTNIRLAGEDFALGSPVLPVGTQISAQQIAVLAGLGVAQVTVRQRISVALLSTGNELRELGEPLKQGQIYDCNRYLLRQLLQSLGCIVHDYGIAPDDFLQTRALLEKAAAEHSLVVSSGGVSVGEEDHVKAVLQSLGEMTFWKVAIKPGKPLAVGSIAKSQFFGLPGNPVSCWVSFMLMLKPYLLACMGVPEALPKPLEVQADFSRTKVDADRTEFVRATLRCQADGLFAQAVQAQGSAMLSGLLAAQGLLEIPAGKTVQLGDRLNFYPF